MSLFRSRRAWILRFRGTRGTSVRLCLKTHEIHSEAHHESNSSMNVCSLVADEMDEEIMDDKEQNSEIGTKEDDVTDVGRTGGT